MLMPIPMPAAHGPGSPSGWPRKYIQYFRRSSRNEPPVLHAKLAQPQSSPVQSSPSPIQSSPIPIPNPTISKPAIYMMFGQKKKKNCMISSLLPPSFSEKKNRKGFLPPCAQENSYISPNPTHPVHPLRLIFFFFFSHCHPPGPSPPLPTSSHPAVHAHPAHDPVAAAPRRHARPSTGQLLQRDLGGVLLGVADVLSVIPEARLHQTLTGDGHGARPGRAAATTVREDVEHRRVKLGATAVICPRVKN